MKSTITLAAAAALLFGLAAPATAATKTKTDVCTVYTKPGTKTAKTYCGKNVKKNPAVGDLCPAKTDTRVWREVRVQKTTKYTRASGVKVTKRYLVCDYPITTEVYIADEYLVLADDCHTEPGASGCWTTFYGHRITEKWGHAGVTSRKVENVTKTNFCGTVSTPSGSSSSCKASPAHMPENWTPVPVTCTVGTTTTKSGNYTTQTTCSRDKWGRETKSTTTTYTPPPPAPKPTPAPPKPAGSCQSDIYRSDCTCPTGQHREFEKNWGTNGRFFCAKDAAPVVTPTPTPAPAPVWTPPKPTPGSPYAPSSPGCAAGWTRPNSNVSCMAPGAPTAGSTAAVLIVWRNSTGCLPGEVEHIVNTPGVSYQCKSTAWFDAPGYVPPTA